MLGGLLSIGWGGWRRRFWLAASNIVMKLDSWLWPHSNMAACTYHIGALLGRREVFVIFFRTQ